MVGAMQCTILLHTDYAAASALRYEYAGWSRVREHRTDFLFIKYETDTTSFGTFLEEMLEEIYNSGNYHTVHAMIGVYDTGSMATLRIEKGLFRAASRIACSIDITLYPTE